MKKMFFLTLLISLFNSQNFASANPVRVLISISKDKTSERFSHQVFKKMIKNGFADDEFSITEDVDQFALYQALNDPETQALIWISHGATPRLSRKMKRQSSSPMGMSAQPELVDYRGDNVAPIFKKYSSSIKYVAVIGCNSQQILDYVDSDLDSDENINTYIPSKKVIAQWAIRKSIRQLSNIDLNDVSTAQTYDPNQPILELTRSLPMNAPAELIRPLRVMIGSELIGVLPAIQPGETKTFYLPVTQSGIKQIKVESGQNIMTPIEEVYFGELQITLPNKVTMKAFSKSDGTPFGLNFRLYILP